LRELVEKYRALLELCIERDAFAAAGVLRLQGEAQRQRRARARALARRFPGCLRELDGATAVGLKARLETLVRIAEERSPLARSAEEPSPLPLWVRVVSDFHADLRRLLAIRRAGGALPSRRMHDLVFDQLAARYGVTREIVRAIVHEGRCER
jgi:hypothetical protein